MRREICQESEWQMGADICDFKINGTQIPLDSESDLKRLVRYLEKRIEWMNSSPRFAEIDLAEKPRGSESPGDHESGAKFNPPTGKRTIDYVMRALRKFRGRGLFSEVYQEIIDYGWTTDSPDTIMAKRNLRATINKYEKWVRSEGENLFLKPEGLTEINRVFPEEGQPESLETLFDDSANVNF